MTTSITALDLIRRSMYLINALAAGETPDAQSANDALQTLNEMIDSWSIQSLAVYGTANDEFPTVPGKSIYTYGTGGDINEQRPAYVNASYCVRQGVTTPVRVIDILEYNTIPLKGTTQPLVERAVWTNAYPLSTIMLWPVPSEVVTIGLTSGRILTNVANLQTSIDLPPGYLKALRYNLAVDLWPEYSNKITDFKNIQFMAM